MSPADIPSPGPRETPREDSDESAHGLPNNPKAFAPKYFEAAGIVFLSWAAFVFATTSLASLGLIRSDSIWILGLIAMPIVYFAQREFRNRGLALKHLTPFAIIVGAILALIAIS